MMGTDDEHGERNHNDQGDGGQHDELEHLGNVLIEPLVQVRVDPDRQDGRDNRGVVVHENHGDAEEVRHGAVARVAHEGDEVRVEQARAEQRRQVRARAEALAGGEAEQHGQEVEHAHGQGVQDGVGTRALSDDAELGGQDNEAAQDTGAGHGGQQRGKDAGDRGEDDRGLEKIR